MRANTSGRVGGQVLQSHTLLFSFKSGPLTTPFTERDPPLSAARTNGVERLFSRPNAPFLPAR
jgi:hypothetical protein